MVDIDKLKIFVDPTNDTPIDSFHVADKFLFLHHTSILLLSRDNRAQKWPKMAIFRLSGPVGLYTGLFRKKEGQIRTQRQKLSRTGPVRLRNSATRLPTVTCKIELSNFSCFSDLFILQYTPINYFSKFFQIKCLF